MFLRGDLSIRTVSVHLTVFTACGCVVSSIGRLRSDESSVSHMLAAIHFDQVGPSASFLQDRRLVRPLLGFVILNQHCLAQA